MNIAEILLKLQDIADAPFDAATFSLSLIEAYSPPKATLAKLRQGTLNKADRESDLLWPKKSIRAQFPQDKPVLHSTLSRQNGTARKPGHDYCLQLTAPK